MSTPPTTWDEALLAAGLVDPRNGTPSVNQLAKRIGMAASAVSAIRHGRTKPKPATIQKIADGLGIDARIVAAWVGEKRTERDPYTPPAEADLLTDRQRRAVDEIIRAIVAERASTDRDHATAQPDPRDPHSPVARDAQPDGATRHLSPVPRKLSWAEREEMYARAREVDLDAEPYAAADPEDPGEGHDSL